MNIGIIAEDDSDVKSIVQLIKKIINKKFSHSKFVGDGCGKLLRKIPQWSRVLKDKGCNILIIVHDLDRNKYQDLYNRLDKVSDTNDFSAEKKHICIPIEELEAWLLSDTGSLKKFFNIKKNLPVYHDPEKVKSPKEEIESIIYKFSDKRKRYINSVHNPNICQNINISNLKRCSSYKQFETFLLSLK